MTEEFEKIKKLPPVKEASDIEEPFLVVHLSPNEKSIYLMAVICLLIRLAVCQSVSKQSFGANGLSWC